MRFFADGPSIPDTLIDELDEGNVVFLCGAGVSIGSGLPDFKKLTKEVLRELGTAHSAQSSTLFRKRGGDLQLDRVFFRLQQEYSAPRVESAVHAILRRRVRPVFEQHRTVLELSRTSAGAPLVLTTNFDHLFEDALASMADASGSEGPRYYVGPELPDLRRNPNARGIVYLHGRLSDPEDPGAGRARLVLSSSDFGRAYLADGWAARFVRDACETRVIVLLGYSANDPPVSYLLEGLHAMRSDMGGRIYAFDADDGEPAVTQWQRKGVTPIVYAHSRDHSALWNTLRAWAARSRDVAGWRSQVCQMAQRGPRALEPFERGQVVSLVRSPAGAKCFADSEPPLPAEWLCVFDRRIRCGATRAYAAGDDASSVSPYLLDGEEFSENPAARAETENALDLLEQVPDHGDPSESVSLKGNGAHRLPRRLHHVMRWIVSAMDDPGVAWWAAGYNALHPQLLSRIEYRHVLQGKMLENALNHTWSLLLEAHSEQRGELSWRELNLRLRGPRRESGLRALEGAARPYLKVTRPMGGWPSTVDQDGRRVGQWHLARFEVKVSGLMHLEIDELPRDVVPRVFEIALRGLERASSLLADIGNPFFHVTTLIPEDKAGEPHHDGVDRYLLIAKALLDRLLVEQPDVACVRLRHWISDPARVFEKLRMYGWMKSQPFSAAEVAAELLALPGERFWDDEHRRELLHLLRARWEAFDDTARGQLERRILEGRPIFEGEEEHEYRTAKAVTTVGVLRWLLLNACTISDEGLAGLSAVQLEAPGWKDEWAASADESHGSRGGVVKFDRDFSMLIAVPLSDVVSVAEGHIKTGHHGFTEREPFRGLLLHRPARAVAALSYEARHQRYSIKCWQDAFATLHEGISSRLQWVFANRVVCLPREVLVELRSYAPQWLLGYLPRLASLRAREALALWDKLAEHFLGAAERDPEVSRSNRGAGYWGTVRTTFSRRTAEHAGASPFGVLTRALIQVMKAMPAPSRKHELDGFESRLQRLLGVSGEGADHVVCACTQFMRSLYEFHAAWVHETMMSWFHPSSGMAEPAWSGYFHRRESGGLPRDLFVCLVPHLLGAFKHASEWHWDGSAVGSLSSLLVRACSEGFVTTSEARVALQRAGREGCATAADLLGQMHGGPASEFVRTFLEQGWPQELSCRDERVSRELAQLAWKNAKAFPGVVDSLCEIIDPLEHLVLPPVRGGGPLSEIAKNFPDKMLRLLDRLVPTHPQTAPHGLNEVLRAVAEAAPQLRQFATWRRLNALVSR